MSTTETHSKTDTLVPELRFREFDGHWNKNVLGDLTKYTKGYAFKSEDYRDEGIRIVRVSDLAADRIKSDNEKVFIDPNNAKDYEKYKLREGNIIITTVGSKPEMIESAVGRGIFIDSEDEGLLNQNMLKFENLENVDNGFVIGLINSRRYQHYMKGIARGNANQANITVVDLLQYKVSAPSLPEQQKIASFLSAVDEKIQQLSRKKALLEQYKKGVMQQIFSQQIRFKDDDGNDFPNWEEKKMKDVFDRVTRKNKENNLNVLTISAQQGLINQQKYFNKSVSAKDVSGYYLLHKGEFAYNKSYSKGYPMGAIKKLKKFDKGVVSTLYICFGLKDNNDSVFYEEFLDSGGINRELHKIAQEGARNHGLLNMSVVEFFKDMNLTRPSYDEQLKIGKILSDLSARIVLANNQLTRAQEFKKGLLQKMFV